MSIKRTIITTVVALALVAVVAPGVAQGLTIDELLAQIATLQSQLLTLQGSTTTPPAGGAPSACAGVTFTRNLIVGSTGSDVKCLQAILNLSATTKVALTGAGSPGLETTYFGPKTLVAVKTYQVEHGWTPANQVGPMTRAALNASISGGTLPPVIPPVTGTVSAALAVDNPAAGALINGQATADLLHINFAGTGTITSVTLQRSGISNQNTLSNIYLFDGATRITDGYSFNVNGTTVINGLSIAVNGPKTISVRADVSSTATTDSSSVAVALTGFTVGGAVATANVQGNNMMIVVGTAASVYLAATGMTPTATINAGTTQNTFWTNSIQVNTRAVLLKTANFRMIGSAPSDALANLRLFVDGVDTGKIAIVGTITGSNYAMFDLTSAPITLTTGSHTIDVRADVQKGTNRTVQFSVQQASDLTITDPQVGVNIAALGAAGAAFTSNSGTTFTISWGTTATTVESSFNAVTNVTSGATNAVIGKFTVHAYGEDVKVSSLQVTPLIKSAVATNCTTDASGTTVTSACGLNNVTLYFNGSQIGSSANWTHALMAAATPITYTLGSQMIIPAGQDSTIEVRADLQTAAGAAYTSGTILTTLEGDTDNAYGQSSQYTVGVPQTSDISTTGLSISSATLAVSKSTAYASQVASPNTTNVKIGSFVVQNQSTAESVRLTTLTVNLTSDGTTALNTTDGTSYTGLSALRTSDTTGSGSTPIQPAASNTFSVSDILAPGASMTIDIFANTGSSTLLSAVVTRLTVASIGATSNISSAGTITTGQTITLGTGTITNPPTKATSTTVAQYVLGGGVSRASFSFLSTSGASTINELKFVVSGTDAIPTGTVTTVCVGTVCGSPVSGIVTLQGLSLAVPNGGGGLTVDAQVTYAGVGTSGIVPGNTSTVGLTYVKYLAGGTTKTICSSGCTATLSADVAANNITLVGSKPVVTVAAGGGAGLVINQSTKVGDISVKAEGGVIKIDQMVFNVTFSGYSTLPTSTTAASLTDGSGNAIPGMTCDTGSITSGAITVTCTSTTDTYAGHYPISLGATQQFNLYVTTAGGANTGASTPTASSSITKAGFVWDDTSYNGSGSSGMGLTGQLLADFPTTTYSISVTN